LIYLGFSDFGLLEVNPKRGLELRLFSICFLSKSHYVNGMGFRGIERLKGVHHTTVINWVKSVGELLPGVPMTQKQFLK
jgi:hypothetical protein